MNRFLQVLLIIASVMVAGALAIVTYQTSGHGTKDDMAKARKAQEARREVRKEEKDLAEKEIQEILDNGTDKK